MKYNKSFTKGFTLIELLVVIAIIGILSSVVLASLNTARESSRDARRLSDVKQIQAALELYFDDKGEYPDALANLASTYISVVPTDPVGGVSYVYNAYTTATIPPVVGNDCDEASETCLFYHLGASLEGSPTSALNSDLDADGDAVDGPDADGCSDEAGRQCYDVVP
ncbi:MAG: prepilin-type N-terminal cleavage/methylation domain-containing protein [Candidatus Paceibacterota bacterium]